MSAVRKCSLWLGVIIIGIVHGGLSACQAAVVAGRLDVVQNDTGNTTASVTVTKAGGTFGFAVASGSNRADYNISYGQQNDYTGGIPLACIRENGRDNGESNPTGVRYGTAAVQSGNGPPNSSTSTWWIPVFDSSVGTPGGTYPGGNEFNFNPATAYFPFAEGWRAGYGYNSTWANGGTHDRLLASPGIVLGANYVDAGGGVYTLDLTNLAAGNQTSASSGNGILLVTGGKNEDNYALSQANANGTFTIKVHDNGTDGSGAEADPVSFVYLPKNACYINPATGQPSPLPMGKIWGDNSVTLSQGNPTVTRPSTGTYRLSLPGFNEANGTLIISAECGGSTNGDNIVSYKWNPTFSAWDIQTRDLPNCGLQSSATTEAVASFTFIPDDYDVYDRPSAYGAATWSGSGGGNWHFDNFTPSGGTLRMMPNLPGNEAKFLGALQTAGSINVMDLRTVGKLTIDNSAAGYTLSGGTIQLKSNSSPSIDVLTGQHSVASTLIMNSSSVIDTAGGAQLTVSGMISGSGAVGLTKRGDGTLILSSANSYSGGTTLETGMLQLGHSGALGTYRSVTVHPSATLRLAGKSPNLGSLAGTGVVENAGAMAATMTIGGDHSTAAFSGTIQDGAGGSPLSLTKVGTGTQSLGGVYTATGPVSIHAGTLQLSGGLALPGSVTVQSGAGLRIYQGSTPATTQLASNLSLGLASSDATTLTFALDGPWSSGTPLLDVAGTTASGGTTTVNVASSTIPAVGAYPLLHYTGSLTGSFTLGSLPGPRFVATLQDNLSASQLELVITAADRIKWQGSVDGVWDTATTPNWKLVAAGTADTFLVNDNPLFDDSASGTTAISISSTVYPSGMEFQNNTLSYSIHGPGKISGASALSKSGSGLLTLTSDNDYSGATTVTAGTLQLGDGGATGSVSGDLINNATVVLDRSADLTLPGAVSGSGSLVKHRNNRLTLTGNNSFHGVATVSSGTLQIGDGGITGSLAGDIVNNGTVVFNRSNTLTFTGAIGGSGAVVQQGYGMTVLTASNTYDGGTTIASGTLQIGNGGAAGSVAGDVVNQGMIAFHRADDIVFDGLISGNGGLVKLGAGTLTLTADNTYQGNTLINAGALVLSRTGDFQPSSGFFNGAGNLVYQGSGTWTVDLYNQVSGMVTIQSGTVAFPGAGKLATGSMLVKQDAVVIVNSTNNLGTGSTILDGGTLVQTGDVVFANPVAVTSNGGTFDTGANPLTQLTLNTTFSGPIDGTITKRGAGAMYLNASQGFAGNWNILEGSVINGPYDTQSNTSFVTVAAGATFDDSYGNGENFAGLEGEGTVIIKNTNSMLLLGNQSNTFAGIIRNGESGTIGPGTGGNLNKSGSGMLTLSGTNSDFNGYTAVLKGAVAVVANALPFQNGPLGNSASPVYLGDTAGSASTAFYLGAEGVEVGRDIHIRSGNTGNATVGSLNTAGTARFSGGLYLGTGTPKGVTVFADSGGNFELAGGIHVGGPPGAGYTVVKEGLGNMVFSGSMDASVGVVLNGGTLSLAPTASLGANTVLTLGGAAGATGVLDLSAVPGFAVAPGQTLRGLSGLVQGGPLRVQGTINPGSESTVGTLPLDFLTIDAASNDVGLSFRATSGGNDVLAVHGPDGLTINTTGSNTAVINVVPAGGGAATYTVITYSGSLGGAGFSGFRLNPHVIGTLVNSGSSIDVQVTQFDRPRWVGAVDGNWNGSTINWKQVITGNATAYTDQVYPFGDDVVFDDGSDVLAADVNLAGAVQPRSVLVNSSSVNYSFSGSGAIGGPTTLLKQGSGTLTIGVSNSYTGLTTIQGGTVLVSPSATLSNGPTTIQSGGVLAISSLSNLNTSSALTLDGGTLLTLADFPASIGLTVTENGGTIDTGLSSGTLTAAFPGPVGSTLTKAGTGALFINVGASAFHGNWHVTGGTLRNGKIDGQGADTIVYVDAGATFDDSFGDGEGMGGIGGAGTVIMRNAYSYSFVSDVSTTFSGRLTAGLNGAIGPGTAGNITKAGSGTLTITGTDSDYTGTTTVNEGSLVIGASVVPNTNSPLGNAATAVNLGSTSGSLDASFFIGSEGATMGRDILVRSGNTGVITVGGLNASGTATVSGKVLLGTSGGDPRDVTLHAEDGGTVEFLGGIQVNGRPGAGYVVTKTGPGTIVLSGSNNYTGGTILAGGTLVLSGTNTAMGATQVVDGTLILDGPDALADGSALSIGALASSVFSTPLVPAVPSRPDATTGVTPVPEPDAFLLLTWGAVGMAVILRRRLAVNEVPRMSMRRCSWKVRT